MEGPRGSEGVEAMVEADGGGVAKPVMSIREATSLWRDPCLVRLSSRWSSERRMLVVGRVHDVFWTAIARRLSTDVEIISARYATEEEVGIYEQANWGDYYQR